MKFNEQPGTFRGRAEVRLVRNLPGPIERVWDYLTVPEKRAKWFASGDMEPRVGGKANLFFKLKDLAPNETPPANYAKHHDPGMAVACTVTRWEPPRVLGFTFGSTGESEVLIELTRRGLDVQIVITHRTSGEDLDYTYEFASGWHLHLAVLEAQLRGTPNPPFWSTKAKLLEHYQTAFNALPRV